MVWVVCVCVRGGGVGVCVCMSKCVPVCVCLICLKGCGWTHTQGNHSVLAVLNNTELA